jgi:hypothetical protein
MVEHPDLRECVEEGEGKTQRLGIRIVHKCL